MRKHFAKITLYLSVLNIISFISFRYVWSAFVEMLNGSPALAYIILALLVLTFGAIVAEVYFIKKRILFYVLAGFTALFTFLNSYIFVASIDYAGFFFTNFFPYLSVVIFLYALIFLILNVLSKRKERKLALQLYSGLLIATTIFGGMKLSDLGLMRFVAKPVVYAVEDTYQISFTTARNSSGSVIINNETYHSSASGRAKVSKTHKITVPMTVLDSAKHYEVKATHVLYPGPYSGLTGRTLRWATTFRPVDQSDGLKFHVASDFHDKMRTRVASVTYKRDELDFVVLAGDISSFLETPANINFINKSAHAISRGEIAVIYGRGNHETKGIYNAALSEAVGSNGENYYYTVRFGDIFIVVLDLAEDHHDEWWEFYDFAYYDDYRAKQLAWLQSVYIDADNTYKWDEARYRFIISHQPLSVINEDAAGPVFAPEKQALVDVLNHMQIDASFAGHYHDLFFLNNLAKGELEVREGIKEKLFHSATGANFPEFITSRQSTTANNRKLRLFQAFTSLRVEINNAQKQAYFVNNKHETVRINDPFTAETYTLITF